MKSINSYTKQNKHIIYSGPAGWLLIVIGSLLALIFCSIAPILAQIDVIFGLLPFAKVTAQKGLFSWWLSMSNKALLISPKLPWRTRHDLSKLKKDDITPSSAMRRGKCCGGSKRKSRGGWGGCSRNLKTVRGLDQENWPSSSLASCPSELSWLLGLKVETWGL